MQIVIDITDETYEYMTPKEPREMTNKKAAEWFVMLYNAIFVNGKVLPKGHGRLVDADALAKRMAEYGWHHSDSTVHEFVDDFPTIIEADKEAIDGSSD